MNTSTIIHLPPGRTADTAFLAEAVVKFPTVFGFAFQQDGVLEEEVHSKAWKAEEIQEILEYAKDGHRVLMMGNWPQAKLPDDIQPYVLRDQQDQPILAMFMEGDFAGYSGIQEGHTDEYNVSDEVVFPRIEKAWKDAECDFDKFVEELRGGAVARTLKNAFKHRGYFLLLPRTGDPIIIAENEIGGTYSWGTASNVAGLSYKEASAAPEVKETGGGNLSFLDRMRGKKASAEPATPPPVPNKEEPNTPSVIPTRQPDKQLDKPATDTSIPLVQVSPPPGLTGGAKNHWLRLFNAKSPGDLPADHQSNKVQIWVHPSMVEFAKRQVSNTKEMRKLVEEVKHAQKGGDPKDMKASTNDTGKSTTREPATNYVNTSTVLDVKDKEKAVGLLAGFLDKKLSPLEIQKSEAKWPQFSDEVGVSFEELLFLSADQIMQLTGGNKIATAMVIQFRRKFIEGTNLKLEDLVTSGSKGEEPKDTKVSEVEKHILAKEELKPAAAQGGGLSFLRRTG